MNPLLLAALAFFIGKRMGSPAWPKPGHPPPMAPVLITKHGVTPLAPPSDATSHATPSTEHTAAQALFDYLTGANPNWGFPGRPSPHVAAAQKAMGGGLKPDGIYGAKTQARCSELLGQPCPARPSAQSQAKSAALSHVSKLIPRIP